MEKENFSTNGNNTTLLKRGWRLWVRKRNAVWTEEWTAVLCCWGWGMAYAHAQLPADA